jgi:hypothetical protein
MVTAIMVTAIMVTAIMVTATTITGTMVTGMDTATVGGGMGAGMVMGSEPAGPGRRMATSGFATSW